jgi:16S rRNA (guanine527-N7)-methyltransferase
VNVSQEIETLANDPQIQPSLARFTQLLAKWNKVYNLTAIRDPQDMWRLHILDSLTLTSHLPSTVSVLDVGSGAGLPGIPIAIARPDLNITSIDAVAKKIAFQKQVVAELGLHNHHPLHTRVEDHAGQYSIITARAFASLVDFTRLTRNLLAPGGRWLAMKGDIEAVELQALPEYIAHQTITLHVPGTELHRHLIELRLR